MKMPAEIRTALRKIIRNHPNVTDFVKTKSEVNNLKRDDLIALADNLGMDFIQELQDAVESTFQWESQMEHSSDPNFTPPFEGEFVFDVTLSALGVESPMRAKVEYLYTPEWQYLCPVQKRLKYRRAGGTFKGHLEVVEFDTYLENGEYREKESRKWIDGGDWFWKVFEDELSFKIYDRIDDLVWEEDKANRAKMGFEPGERPVQG